MMTPHRQPFLRRRCSPRVGTRIPLVARCYTRPAQRWKTPATCREPCTLNRHPSPDNATATSIARCGTISAQRHVSAQSAGTKARRLVRTSQEDAYKGSNPPHHLAPTLLLPRGSIRILYKYMRDVFENAIVPQQHPCVVSLNAQQDRRGRRDTPPERLYNRRSARR